MYKNRYKCYPVLKHLKKKRKDTMVETNRYREHLYYPDYKVNHVFYKGSSQSTKKLY